MNKIILLILFTISFRTSMANDIKVSVILQNCNVCHTEESTKSNIIRPLKTLEKKLFFIKDV